MTTKIDQNFSRPLFGSLLFFELLMLLAVQIRLASAEGLEFNRRATATAQILAGITPSPNDPALRRLVELDAFREHQQWMSSQWNQVRGRMQAMENWRNHEIRFPGAQRKTLLYPFSGPDFLNAYTFFPDHARYIFFSLERPGALPDLESVTPVQFTKLLQDLRGAFRDIFERNYFITSYMNKQLMTPWVRGSVPVMATMMALMDHRIVRIEPIDLYPELTGAYDALDSERPRMMLRGARIDFFNTGSGAAGLQQLFYFSVDVSDKALQFYPDFLNWVGSHKPATTLLKSASYLLHDAQFSKTRAMILDSADVVLQDDTGIPYRFLKQSPWHVKLYGKYSKPIKPMTYGYQKDLEAAYSLRTEQSSLPFPFGYHWRGQKSGLIMADR